MRLTLSVLAAVGLHGALFGVAAALLPHAPAKPQLPPQIDVMSKWSRRGRNPVADSAPAPAAPTPAAIPPRPHAPTVTSARGGLGRQFAVRLGAGGRSAEPEIAPISVAAPPASPSPARAASAKQVTAQGGGAVVSAQPRYHTNPRPDYPIPSLRRREEGIVLLNVQVQANGTPAAISLNRSCGHPLLDRAALDAVRRWTFEPARAAGVPVSSLVVIPVRFSLDDC